VLVHRARPGRGAHPRPGRLRSVGAGPHRPGSAPRERAPRADLHDPDRPGPATARPAGVGPRGGRGPGEGTPPVGADGGTIPPFPTPSAQGVSTPAATAAAFSNAIKVGSGGLGEVLWRAGGRRT